MNIVTRCEVLTGFSHIVFLIEFAQQFFKDSSHRMVIESWQSLYHLNGAIFLGLFLHYRKYRKVNAFICELL